MTMKKKMHVLDSTGVWREAEILSEGATKYFVHFLNFKKIHDGEYDKG